MFTEESHIISYLINRYNRKVFFNRKHSVFNFQFTENRLYWSTCYIIFKGTNYIHTYYTLHAYYILHTYYIHTYYILHTLHTYRYTYIRTYIHAYIYAYITSVTLHKYIHTYTYIHSYIHTYTHLNSQWPSTNNFRHT